MYLHSDNKCYSECPMGFFGGLKDSKRTCLQCSDNCKTCSAENDCTSCKDSKKL